METQRSHTIINITLYILEVWSCVVCIYVYATAGLTDACHHTQVLHWSSWFIESALRHPPCLMNISSLCLHQTWHGIEQTKRFVQGSKYRSIFLFLFCLNSRPVWKAPFLMLLSFFPPVCNSGFLSGVQRYVDLCLPHHFHSLDQYASFYANTMLFVSL